MGTVSVNVGFLDLMVRNYQFTLADTWVGADGSVGNTLVYSGGDVRIPLFREFYGIGLTLAESINITYVGPAQIDFNGEVAIVVTSVDAAKSSAVSVSVIGAADDLCTEAKEVIPFQLFGTSTEDPRI